VIAASSNGYVYAVNAVRNGDVAPGRVLWRTRLGAPCRLQPAPLDGVPTGVLSTPVVDRVRGRLYVTSCDPEQRWQAYALDIHSGAVLPG
jgi:outer membrane protein assembly factor BamB